MSEQDHLAAHHGLKEGGPVYVDTKNSFPKERAALFDSMRVKDRDKIWVSDLGVIAQTRAELTELRAALKKKDAAVFEGRTSRITSNGAQFAEMLIDWTDYIARKRHPHKVAVATGRVGGIKAARNRAHNRPPKYAMLEIWLDRRLTWQDALDKINALPGYDIEISRSWAYKNLKSRGSPMGPRKR